MRPAWMILPVVALCLALGLVGIPAPAWGQAVGGNHGPAAAGRLLSGTQGCGGGSWPSADETAEARTVELVNQVRAEHGLPPLKMVEPLRRAARFHARDMALESYFTHDSQDRVDGELTRTCAWSARVTSFYPDWLSMAENIAAGYPSPENVVAGWMDSAGHRANILGENNWEIGVGYFVGETGYRHFWVQDFGRRKDVYPLVIDGEALSTETGDVSLYLYGDWEEVRLRTDDGAWGPWQPFDASMAWRIHGDRGEHTVEAQMRRGATTATASDTIHLNTDNPPAPSSSMPANLIFLYDVENRRLTPGAHILQPLPPGASARSWQASVDGNWLSINPTRGGAGQSVTLAPRVSAAGAGEMSGALHITLHDEEGAVVAEHHIHLSLQDAAGFLYLPSVRNGG